MTDITSMLNMTPLQVTGCILMIIACIALIIYLIFRKSYSRPAEQEEVAPASLVGEHATVVETVDGDAGTGLVEIDGEGWAARSVYTDDVYEVGSRVEIVAVEGVKLIVKPES